MYLEAKDKRKPIGILMIEHRLIEKALDRLEARVEGLGSHIDVIGLAELVDFFGTYADDTHHGKEEDILFVEAGRLLLDDDLKEVMEELREDHVRFRGFRADMDRAVRKIADGREEGIEEFSLAANMFIPRLRDHIKKEDQVFFPGFDDLQKPADREALMQKFMSFDMEIVHETYKKVVERNG